ncbi:hypothetical protein CLOM_g21329 [Closterium sp. NIES-68]|nr:hypothetical protein CLOM_g21329 [Closterium sp. NIES-68]GJP71931.1 hypothetical protein CLOP_g2717 [Closterium sp. NIES-67]
MSLLQGSSLSPYFTAALTLAQRTHQQLHDAGSAFQSVPFDLIIIGHALATSAAVRIPLLRRHWLLCFWTAFFTGYGGGTLTSLLLHDHFVWLRNDYVLLLFALCWWVITYSPYDLGNRLYSFTPIKLLARLAASIARTGVVISRIDGAVRRFGKHSIVAPLFIGTLGGCGGRLVLDLVLSILAPSAASRAELLYPSWLSRSAFLITLGYSLTVHWTACCSSQAAYGAIASFLMAHSTWEVISRSPWDPTVPLSSSFHSLLCIPFPPAALSPSRHHSSPPHSKPHATATNSPSSSQPPSHNPATGSSSLSSSSQRSSREQDGSEGTHHPDLANGKDSTRSGATSIREKAVKQRKPKRA